MKNKKFCPNYLRKVWDTPQFEGLYILLSSAMDVLYVGQSNDVPRRIQTSLKERIKMMEKNKLQVEFSFASFAKTETLNDLDVYEKLYIAQTKPILNMQKKEDKLTLEFPPLLFSTPFQIYDKDFAFPDIKMWPRMDIIFPEDMEDNPYDGSIFNKEFVYYDEKSHIYFEGLPENMMTSGEKTYRDYFRKDKSAIPLRPILHNALII